MNAAKTLLVLPALVLAQSAAGDWDVGDPYKMHHPQTPDLVNGMDILDGPYATATASQYEKFLAEEEA